MSPAPLTSEEKAIAERLLAEARKASSAVPEGARVERFNDSPLGLDDEGKPFPAPAAENPEPAVPPTKRP